VAAVRETEIIIDLSKRVAPGLCVGCGCVRVPRPFFTGAQEQKTEKYIFFRRTDEDTNTDPLKPTKNGLYLERKTNPTLTPNTEH
jgi:hypothetical protein